MEEVKRLAQQEAMLLEIQSQKADEELEAERRVAQQERARQQAEERAAGLQEEGRMRNCSIIHCLQYCRSSSRRVIPDACWPVGRGHSRLVVHLPGSYTLHG